MSQLSLHVLWHLTLTVRLLDCEHQGSVSEIDSDYARRDQALAGGSLPLNLPLPPALLLSPLPLQLCSLSRSVFRSHVRLDPGPHHGVGMVNATR